MNLTNSQALLLAASNVGTGTLTINALGISQSGALVQAPLAGAAAFDAGHASLLLNHAGNQFTGMVSLSNSGPGTVAILNAVPLTVSQVLAGSGNLSIQSTGLLTIGQTLGPAMAISTSGAVNLATVSSGDISLLQAIGSTGGGVTMNSVGAIGMASSVMVNAGAGALSLTAAGNLDISALATTSNSLLAVTLTSQTGSVAAAGHAHANIAASGGLSIHAAGGIGSGDPLGLSVASLSAENSTSGNMEFSSSRAITLLKAVQDTGGNIMVASSDTLTVGTLAAPGAAVSTLGSGGITLTTGGNAADLVVDQSVRTASGAIDLTSGQALMLAGTASVGSTSGAIGLQATGNIALSLLSTTTTVSVSSSGAAITPVSEPGANITANALALSAATGIGSAAPLVTSVSTLAASNSTSGGIQDTNVSAGLLTIGTVGPMQGLQLSGAAPAAINVTTAGPLMVVGGVSNTTGGDITLASTAQDTT